MIAKICAAIQDGLPWTIIHFVYRRPQAPALTKYNTCTLHRLKPYPIYFSCLRVSQQAVGPEAWTMPNKIAHLRTLHIC